jgi:hypothetical protein
MGLPAENFQVTHDRIDGTRDPSELASYRPEMTMRTCRQIFCWQVFCRQLFAVAIILFATPSVAGAFYRMSDDLPTFTPPIILVANEAKQQEPDIDIFALMSGKCRTLAIAGRVFTCRSVAFFHSTQGRAYFTIALDDPTDDGHIISFSGENGQRGQDNLYELPIDRMLLNSKHRPKVDGLPVPFVEFSAGICKQLGNFAARQVSSISCTAMDNSGKKYELQFESDGSPITVRRIRQSPPTIREYPSN